MESAGVTRISENVKWIVGIATILSPIAFAGVNPPLILAGLWLPVVFGVLLWREGEIPVLLFVLMLQWLEVFTGVFYSNLRSIPMEALFGGPELNRAIWLGAVALGVSALGARIGLIGAKVCTSADLYKSAKVLSIVAVWKLYVACWVIAAFSVQLAGFSGQIQQIALGLSGVELVAYFVLAYVVLAQRRDYRFLAAATLIEIGSTLGGFFADFKQPLIVLFIAVIGVMVRITLPRVMMAACVVAAAVFMGVVWTAIKFDYRDYVSGYTGQQIIVRSWTDRMGYLGDSVMNLNSYDMSIAIEKLANRVSYVEYLGYTIRQVPNYVPHEHGRLITEAVEHIIKPRLFFPDKAALESDTTKTERYTGIRFHSAVHTSVGLGYIAEAYVDFGVPVMFLPLLVLGLIWGLIFRFFMWSVPAVFAAGFSIPVIINASLVGLGFNKVLGGMIMGFGVMAMVSMYVLPRIMPWLYRRDIDA